MSQQRRTGRANALGDARSRLDTVTRWRDWNLPVKLGAVMLVPTLLALVFGIVLIQGQVSRSATYTGAVQRTALASKVRAVGTALQNERAAAAGRKVPGNRVGRPELRRLRAATDITFGELRRGFDTTPQLDYAAESGWTETQRQIGRLDSIRSAGNSPLVAPSTLSGYYTDILGSVLGLERALLSKVADPQLAGLAAAVYDIDAAKQEVSFQEATVLVGLTRGRLLRDELDALRGSKTRLDQLIDDLRSVGGDQLTTEYDQTVSGPGVQDRAATFRQILDGADGGIGRSPAESGNDSLNGSLGDIDPAQWINGSEQATDRLNTLGTRISDRLGTEAADLQDTSSNRAGLTAVLLFVALLAAAAIVVVIARQLLLSTRTLQRRARTIAERELPEAVAEIQAGKTVSAEVMPVQVHTREELGQLARAFDDLHSQARRLATEQASLRSSYDNVFVNLSRRSQSLVQRQLRLIERLERDEEDPDQLATLFQLDHLATRMRRNNENLMVLSGSEQGRSAGSQPTGIADLLRAAVSEIEQYQRVEVQPPPGVLIVGYAAGDLVRLVAELLDNATAFSAPETQVTVSARAGNDGSVSIDVIDQGVGMRTEDMTAANDRLAVPDASAVPEARRMGLFVVSRLAGRHGIVVSLHGAEDIDGIRAAILIPSNLVAATEEPAQTMTLAESTAGRDLRAASGPAVGPTLPAAAEPFGSRRDPDQPDYPQYANLGNNSFGGPSIDDRPTEQYPRVPMQERAAASAWASGPSALSEPSTSDIPASDELFVPVRPARPRPDPEQTPIFDEMISAWFVAADSPAAEPVEAEPEQPEEFDIFSVPVRQQVPESGSPSNSPQWNFEADKGWEAVEAVSRSAPESFTSVGLPRRTPRARLVPGSVGTEERQESSAARDPEDVRHRLSSFQRGVSEGRAGGAAARPDAPSTSDSSAVKDTDAGSGSPDGVAEKPDALPQRRKPPRAPESNGAPATDGTPGSNGAPETNGHAGNGTEAKPKPRESKSRETTAYPGETYRGDGYDGNGHNGSNGSRGNGNGNRDNGSNGMTGNRPYPAPRGRAAVEQPPNRRDGGHRDAGHRDGSHRDDGPPETGRPESKPAAERAETTPAGQHAGRPGNDAPRWNFAADDGWRASERAATRAEPEQLTNAGLPRRTPKARLVPGSAGEQQQPGIDAPRDAENVRNRLSSFQRGVTDGRHSLAGTAQDTQPHQQEKE